MEMHVYQEEQHGPGKIVVKGPFERGVPESLADLGLQPCEGENGGTGYMHETRGGEDLWAFALNIDRVITGRE